jgi:hypothetical protein
VAFSQSILGTGSSRSSIIVVVIMLSMLEQIQLRIIPLLGGNNNSMCGFSNYSSIIGSVGSKIGNTTTNTIASTILASCGSYIVNGRF